MHHRPDCYLGHTVEYGCLSRIHTQLGTLYFCLLHVPLNTEVQEVPTGHSPRPGQAAQMAKPQAKRTRGLHRERDMAPCLIWGLLWGMRPTTNTRTIRTTRPCPGPTGWCQGLPVQKAKINVFPSLRPDGVEGSLSSQDTLRAVPGAKSSHKCTLYPPHIPAHRDDALDYAWVCTKNRDTNLSLLFNQTQKMDISTWPVAQGPAAHPTGPQAWPVHLGLDSLVSEAPNRPRQYMLPWGVAAGHRKRAERQILIHHGENEAQEGLGWSRLHKVHRQIGLKDKQDSPYNTGRTRLASMVPPAGWGQGELCTVGTLWITQA